MKKVMEWFRHYQGTSVAIIIVIAVLFWTYGCDSIVTSITNPNTKVTRSELKIEIDTFLAMAEERYRDLDRQDEFKQKLVEFGMIVVEDGTINPIGAGVSLLGILGIGAVVDNRKKDSLVKLLQNEKNAKKT